MANGIEKMSIKGDSTSATGEGSAMQTGAGKAAINLDGVLPFDGFNSQQSDLHVRALVVEFAANQEGHREASSSGTVTARTEPTAANPRTTDRCCIASVEATSLKPEVVDLLRRTIAQATGCAEKAVWITVTHTFSAPHVRTASHLANDAERARNDRLLAAIEEAARAAATQAVQALQPARLAWGSAQSQVNVNRDVETPEGWWLGRDPEGFADHSVPALFFLPEGIGRESSVPDGAADAGSTHESGTSGVFATDTPLAVVFSADVQSSVLHSSPDETLRHTVSGDLAGAAMDALETEFPSCTAFFLTGAAGDQAPATDDLESLADDMAHAVAGCLSTATPLASGEITARKISLGLPGQERADFATLAPTLSYEYVSAPNVLTTVSLLRLGPVALIGLLPEVDSELGARIRSIAPHTLVATLVNGGQKYLPGAASYDRIAYEAMNSAFAKGADQVLLDAVSDALGSIG